jgi:glucose 1-dehydrogenase
MLQTTIKELGGLDILINNAGIQTRVDSHEMTSESFDRVLGVKLHG